MFMSTSITPKAAFPNSTFGIGTNAGARETLSILVVSPDNQNIAECLQFFKDTCTLCGGYSEAKELLRKERPELIILNLPLNQVALVEFKVWLTAEAFNDIPVIYNEAALKEVSIKQLYRQKLVDDVVNIQEKYARLHYKARFISSLNAKNPKVNAPRKKNHLTKIAHNLFVRLMDILISGLAIILLLPVVVFIAFAVKIDSRGPILYRSFRAGKGFKIFIFYKFRTMEANAEQKVEELASLNMYNTENLQPHFFKLENDPRITKLGRFLRNSSLDEIPQLFNVLKGDMSIVGNRPLPLYEASTLTTNEWAERFMAPAGITGLWQITKRGKVDMSSEERIQLDIYYARTRSIAGDLKILFQTPTALMQKANV